MGGSRFAPGHLALGAALLLCASPLQSQVTIGQVDTFEDGTTQGWFVGGGPLWGVHPVPPTNIATGGPQGVDDNYMLLTAVGGPDAGARLTVNNATQWTGNYLAAGVVGISMWVNNFGPDDLFLRLVFEDPMAGPPTNVAFSANAVFVAALSGWSRISFPVLPSALLAGLGSVDAALMNTTLLRLYHSPDPNFPNPVFPTPAVTAQLGVDDITATTIPEPLTFLLLGTGLVGVAAAGRRRQSA